jgi:hypothetical protein
VLGIASRTPEYLYLLLPLPLSSGSTPSPCYSRGALWRGSWILGWPASYGRSSDLEADAPHAFECPPRYIPQRHLMNSLEYSHLSFISHGHGDDISMLLRD